MTSASSGCVFERLDADLRWLESLGAPVLERETGNPLTTGTRFDPDGADETRWWRRAGGTCGVAGEPLREPPRGRCR